jgi:NAD(P)-dependent dehydrogenase (short-subunit alcohol dehydrogenase family)
MIKQAGGIILFITSGAATNDSPLMPDQSKASVGAAYPSSKAAQLRLITSLAKEMKPHNISVIGLDPGSTLTERLQQDTPRSTVRHSMAVPASAAAYLCTCPEPIQYTGLNLIAADLVKERKLLDSYLTAQ